VLISVWIGNDRSQRLPDFSDQRGSGSSKTKCKEICREQKSHSHHWRFQRLRPYDRRNPRQAGHTVYASMRDAIGRNSKNAAEMAETSECDGVDLRAVELDVQSEPSIHAAVDKIIADSGKIDVMIHNAGHMMFGPPRRSRPSSSPSNMTSTC
jgi:hypothetical protein